MSVFISERMGMMLSDAEQEELHLKEIMRRKAPKIVPVMDALAAYFKGEAVSSSCIVCGGLLSVHHVKIEETRRTTTWVFCPSKCTYYRQTGCG
jgi:hypothetical protein